MKLTFVGTFDLNDLDLIKTIATITHFTPFTIGRVNELRVSQIVVKDISYKVVFNSNNKVDKIIFRKVKKVV